MTEHWEEALVALGTEDVPGCLLCRQGSGVKDPVWERWLALRAPYGILRCPNCGLRWLSPRPDADGYRVLYSRETYFSGTGASPEHYDELIVERSVYLLRRFAKIVQTYFGSQTISVLDYGAATGEFVAHLRAKGHRCEGVELSADARQAALERFAISLLSDRQASELPPKTFDVVHMNHVLEHMPNPLAHLRWCAKILRPNGIMVLEVPRQFENDLDRIRRFLRIGGQQRRFDAYSLHHTYFFTPLNLTKLVQVAGFEPQRVTTFNPDKTPLWPPKARNWVLRGLLTIADRVHAGGNIIELIARRKAD